MSNLSENWEIEIEILDEGIVMSELKESKTGWWCQNIFQTGEGCCAVEFAEDTDVDNVVRSMTTHTSVSRKPGKPSLVGLFSCRFHPSGLSQPHRLSFQTNLLASFFNGLVVPIAREIKRKYCCLLRCFGG